VSTEGDNPLFASMANRFYRHSPGLALLAVIWAAVVLESSPIAGPESPGTPMTLLQEEAVLTWDHRRADGAIVQVIATIDDAVSHNMTLPEWVDQLAEWYPPIIR
jgi:hypothetical protein